MCDPKPSENIPPTEGAKGDSPSREEWLFKYDDEKFPPGAEGDII